jgi:hypothetical protein
VSCVWGSVPQELDLDGRLCRMLKVIPEDLVLCVKESIIKLVVPACDKARFEDARGVILEKRGAEAVKQAVRDLVIEGWERIGGAQPEPVALPHGGRASGPSRVLTEAKHAEGGVACAAVGQGP